MRLLEAPIACLILYTPLIALLLMGQPLGFFIYAVVVAGGSFLFSLGHQIREDLNRYQREKGKRKNGKNR